MTTADVWCAIAVTFFIVTDYVTGVAKAIMQNNLNSKKMREGLGHKFAYFILVLTAWFVDEINLHVDLGLPVSVFIFTVGGICIIELTSILENVTAINPELADSPFMSIFSQNTPNAKHSK
jgi:toxin secretion/phage lysis holin